MKHLDYRHQEKWAMADKTLIPQSPIDIDTTQLIAKNDTSLEISLPEMQEVIVKDTPIGIQIYADGDLKWRGHEYMLNRFHFHDGAEHLVNGKRHAAEIHFAFESVDINQLILTVFADIDPENTDNSINDLLDTGHKLVEFDINKLLPKQHTFWTYKGSMTTPPLNQTVTWLILETPIKISQSEKDLLQDKLRSNYRNVQDKLGREIYRVEN
ncbi:carbonic anhydrase family protein [Lactococcus insecticola]|uniref:carbonic anhydrase n=1 Tax=Pseudolactococcus insecticola TaxID=2709158 RepID=A0A6A0B9T9_9LACT|nr:carbonic anhydrase family protein [Lactococcus insecticola]GFH40577.1 carbonic anhydrase [Lactococcus insecticola]